MRRALLWDQAETVGRSGARVNRKQAIMRYRNFRIVRETRRGFKSSPLTGRP